MKAAHIAIFMLKWGLTAIAAFLVVWAFNVVVASFLLGVIRGDLVVIGAAAAIVAMIVLLRKIPANWLPQPAYRLRGADRAGWTPSEKLSPEAAKLRSWMKREAEPAFVMVDPTKPGFSKLGGQPDLPADFNWPMADDAPRHFFMQLDFGELPWGRAKRSSWLPEEGRLWVFFRFDSTERKDLLELHYAAREAPLVSTAAPAGAPVYPELRLGFQRFRAAPSEEWLGPKAEALRTGDQDSFQEEAGGFTFPSFANVAHYVGGYPQEAQSSWLPMEAELSLRNTTTPWRVCLDGGEDLSQEEHVAARDWRMLLQVDTDRRMKWGWGDGQVYVLIRREDAKRLDFSKTVSICQFA